jgi:hypothetical protein
MTLPTGSTWTRRRLGISVISPDMRPVRVNVEHILYYREAALPKEGGGRGMEHGTVLMFVGTDKTLLVRERVEDIDRRINPGHAPTTA